jgi:hypothetical protein
LNLLRERNTNGAIHELRDLLELVVPMRSEEEAGGKDEVAANMRYLVSRARST